MVDLLNCFFFEGYYCYFSPLMLGLETLKENQIFPWWLDEIASASSNLSMLSSCPYSVVPTMLAVCAEFTLVYKIFKVSYDRNRGFFTNSFMAQRRAAFLLLAILALKLFLSVVYAILAVIVAGDEITSTQSLLVRPCCTIRIYFLGYMTACAFSWARADYSFFVLFKYVEAIFLLPTLNIFVVLPNTLRLSTIGGAILGF